MHRAHHLAEANVAWMRYPLEDERMSEFRQSLARVNALAERADGFLWRLQTEEGDSTSVRVLDDPLVLFNMSVWESLEQLRSYAYRDVHGDFLRRRRDWFRQPERPSLVLWWIAPGEIPTVDEAMRRFQKLWAAGASPEAFNFQKPFDPPGEAD